MKLRRSNTNTDPDRPAASRKVRRLRSQLAEARDLGDLVDDPHLHAVRCERFRVGTSRAMWFFLALGLGFTTTGVQDCLAGRLPVSDPMWWGAWLVEPGLAGILITLLRWESEMLAQGVQIASVHVTRLKRVLLGSTLAMNIWAALAPSNGVVTTGSVFVHIVIPTVVFLLAEVMPVIQQRCTTAKNRALAPSPALPPATSAGAAGSAAGVPVTRLRLPPHLRDTLTAQAAHAAEQGRALTATDVQAALKVSPEHAERLARELAATAVPPVNGHPRPY